MDTESVTTWTEVDETTRYLLTSEKTPEYGTPLEALRAMLDLAADLGRLAARGEGTGDVAKAQERRARLAVRLPGLAAVHAPALADQFAEEAAEAVRDWLVALARDGRFEAGWHPEEEAPPSHVLWWEPASNAVRGERGTWLLATSLGTAPLAELIGPPDLRIGMLRAWAATCLPDHLIRKTVEGVPTGRMEIDDSGFPLYNLYAMHRDEIPF